MGEPGLAKCSNNSHLLITGASVASLRAPLMLKHAAFAVRRRRRPCVIIGRRARLTERLPPI
ncbi:MAG: hypothetical protein ACK4ME_02840 [Fimbriimonadales bacterium]